jgi:ABC-type phosphate transport system substrate-binding protein
MRIKLTIAILLFLIASGADSMAQIAVIVNKSVSDTSFTYSKLIDVYTLNKTNWDGGERIKVCDFKGDNKLKTKFYAFIKIDYSRMQKIWLRKQFSGKAIPPRTYKTEEEVIEHVAATPGAIGYVSEHKVDSKVRVIARIE